MPPPERSLVSESDTVVALSTPAGESGLAVVRLTGPTAVAITKTILRCTDFQAGPDSHRAYSGLLVWPTHDLTRISAPEGGRPLTAGEPVDQVVVLPLLAPRSYTGEDTVEIFCHGGYQPARLVIEACLLAGARPAGPGEFTRRAFLNGKLSLERAEAVADLIHAEDERAAQAALRQLRGGFARELAKIASEVRPGLLILYHQLLWGSTEDELLAEIRALYAGPVAYGRDLDVY